MDVSIFLAKVIGLYLIISSIAIFVNANKFHTMLNEVITSPANVFMAGIVTLIIGILLVVSHNVWLAHWPVVITIIAWLIFISGIIRLIFPGFVFDLFKKMNDRACYIIAAIALLVGLYLSYFGFIHK
jgi:hypothetical protein